jgi:hypothetical protein
VRLRDALRTGPATEGCRAGGRQLARTLGRGHTEAVGGALMAPVCIYCRGREPTTSFRNREHVMWDAFGGFKDPLVLRGVVCDDCNQEFGDGLDRYLARDTIEGLHRYRFKVKPAAGYKSAGKRSRLTSRIAQGRWVGAVVWYREADGVLRPTPAPQIGFGRSKEVPFEFYVRLTKNSGQGKTTRETPQTLGTTPQTVREAKGPSTPSPFHETPRLRAIPRTA